MRSFVPPAVIRTVFPFKGEPYARLLSKNVTCSKISSGSGKRPFPLYPSAKNPVAGSIMTLPSALSCATLRTVAGFFHICSFIAGAT